VTTIVGVGGLGSVASEMLARCGIGKLFLFDKDEVSIVNLNRMGFFEKDLGKPKVEVFSQYLHAVNPEVEIIAVHGDIMLPDIDEEFEKAINASDIVLMGLDNFPARTFVNQKCIRLNRILVDAGAARSALSGHVHPIFPKSNACMACTGIIRPPLESAPRGEPCVASLPTTMSILAGIQVQETLKILLGIGTPIDYLTYNAISGQFHSHFTKRDVKCPVCGDFE
jgi:ubiquitin-like modifier-activating enzyme 5